MLTTKLEFQIYTLDAAAKGTLIIGDHAFSGLALPRPRRRTVFTKDVDENLVGIIDSGRFDALLYSNPEHAATPDYVEVKPWDPEFLVTASGFPKLSSVPDSPKDRIIFYSGSQQGWHCCGEESARIQARVAAGTLHPIGPLT